ncbi:MAG: DnaA ATPase domain-containing protein, partial [Longimicrobiales bacterium]
GEGYSTRRLELALATPPKESEIDDFLKQYEQEINRLQQLEAEIGVIEPEAPELVRGDLFRTPDRLRDAEQLLANVRERNRPVPAPPADYWFDTLSLPADSFALRAARAVSEKPSERFNPFLAYVANGEDKTALLAALANELAIRLPERPIAFVKGQNFAAELIQAIEQNCVESWRGRYRNIAAFVLDDIEGLIGTERAQEELFHLFEVLKRAGVQLVFGSSAAPGRLTGLDERLRTRLDSGLVVGVHERNNEPRVAPPDEPPVRIELIVETISTEGESAVDEWFLSREKVVWTWPYLEDWLSEELE